MSPGETSRRAGLRRFLPLLFLLAVPALAWALGVQHVLSLDTLRAERHTLAAFVADQPVVAVAAYLGVLFVATIVLVPGTSLWMSVIGGFLFGLAGGVALSVCGATASATALFLLARSTLGAPLHRHAGAFLRALEAGFQESPFSYMVTMRVLPVMPYPVSNIAPALFGATLRDFAAATFLGLIPPTIAYAWLGSSLGVVFDHGGAPDLGRYARELLPAFFALAAISLAPAVVKRVRRARNASITNP